MKSNTTRTLASKRCEDALTSAPDLMLQMLENAVKMGTPAKHVLFDSWFSAPKTLIAICKLKLFVIAMMKIATKKKFFLKTSYLVLTVVPLKTEVIIEMYGIHWDIEVFIKINKSFLHLTTEFQDRSCRNAECPGCHRIYEIHDDGA